MQAQYPGFPRKLCYLTCSLPISGQACCPSFSQTNETDPLCKRRKIWNKVCNRYYFIFQIPCTGPAWQTRKCESFITPTTLTFTVIFPHKGRLKVSSVMGFFWSRSTILPGVGGSIFPLWNIWRFTDLSHSLWSFPTVYDRSDFLCKQYSLKVPPLFWSDSKINNI